MIETDRHKSTTADVAMYTGFLFSRESRLFHITEGNSQGYNSHSMARRSWYTAGIQLLQ